MIDLPLFGILLTLSAYLIATKLKYKLTLVLLNPILISIVIIVLFLTVFEIEFDSYNEGGQYLSFFLAPSVVAMGVLFYEKYDRIKKNIFPFLTAVCIGGCISISSVVFFAILLNAPDFVLKSIISKSVTTPIAIEISKIIEAIPEITAAVVIAVGIFGNVFGPTILKFLGIRSDLAIGTALGTASHGIGTVRALEKSSISGAYAGLAMCTNGLLTAIVSPYVVIWVLK